MALLQTMIFDFRNLIPRLFQPHLAQKPLSPLNKFTEPSKWLALMSPTTLLILCPPVHNEKLSINSSAIHWKTHRPFSKKRMQKRNHDIRLIPLIVDFINYWPVPITYHTNQWTLQQFVGLLQMLWIFLTLLWNLPPGTFQAFLQPGRRHWLLDGLSSLCILYHHIPHKSKTYL